MWVVSVGRVVVDRGKLILQASLSGLPIGREGEEGSLRFYCSGSRCKAFDD